MRWITPLGAIGTIATIALAAITQPNSGPPEPQLPEPILASFERDLNREPGPTKPVRRESVEHDELYEMLNQAHWTQNKPAENKLMGGSENDETDN